MTQPLETMLAGAPDIIISFLSMNVPCVHVRESTLVCPCESLCRSPCRSVITRGVKLSEWAGQENADLGSE